MALRGPPDERSPAQLLSFGVVNLDKPPGPSAHQVAAWVRDLVGDALVEADSGHAVDRVAHAGTLDPKVTGCLQSLLGAAARAAQVFDTADKEYVTILELHDRAPADFDDVVAEFEGEIYQLPPRKSAVKRQLRTRTIHELDVLEGRERRALCRVRCEAGTYVRKLCHHLGLALGTGAHMGELRRTATGTFDDRDLVTPYDLVDAIAFWLEDGDQGPLREIVSPAERALEGIPQVTIAPSAAEEVAEGAPVYAPGVIEVADGVDEGELVVCVTPDRAAVCLGHLVGDGDAEEGTVVDLERVLV
jgi:tRNA pseudouridine55 synthase